MRFSLASLAALVVALAGTAVVAGPSCGHWPMRGDQDHLPDNPTRIGKREPARAASNFREILRGRDPVPEPEQ